MNRFFEGRSTVDIVTKIFAVIILLFICYKNLTYEQKLEELTNKIIELENADKSGILPEPVEITQAKENMEAKKLICRVYITGAINNPGIYDIEFGARIADLIELAGGASGNANLDIINLAAFVEDATHIKVPIVAEEGGEIPLSFTEGETTSASSATASSQTYDEKPAYTGPVNINTANADRLMSLPGVGQAIANGIIQYRTQNGAFNSPEEIKNVSRIGDALFNNIKDMITY